MTRKAINMSKDTNSSTTDTAAAPVALSDSICLKM